VLSIENLDYLPDLLIKARIAMKLTQKELATFCQRTEEEIKEVGSRKSEVGSRKYSFVTGI
jgi:hypothetical protein